MKKVIYLFLIFSLTSILYGESQLRRELLQSFINEGCWNEARVEVSEKRIGDGVAAPLLSGFPSHIQSFDETKICCFLNKR